MNAEHTRAERLLPWFVNGTLDESELDFVNGHLIHCADCRHAVVLEMELARRISAPTATLTPDFESLRSRLGGARRRRLRVHGWLTGATAAAAALLVGTVLYTVPLREAEYQGLTSAPAIDSGPLVQIVFAPLTSERELRTLLLEGGSQVVDGPSPRGVYRISLPAGADAVAYASRLAAHPAVRFAEAESP